MTWEGRKYNGRKTDCSVNGFRKTGQLHAEESTWTIPLHNEQK